MNDLEPCKDDFRAVRKPRISSLEPLRQRIDYKKDRDLGFTKKTKNVFQVGISTVVLVNDGLKIQLENGPETIGELLPKKESDIHQKNTFLYRQSLRLKRLQCELKGV